jgi:hypothetical protein
MSPSARRIRKSVHSAEQQLLRELLVEARSKAGLTQQKLARRLGRISRLLPNMKEASGDST